LRRFRGGNSKEVWVQFVTGKTLFDYRLSNCIISKFQGFAFLMREIFGLVVELEVNNWLPGNYRPKSRA
jgi:hypothetical protein